jgi:hypothetical protein
MNTRVPKKKRRFLPPAGYLAVTLFALFSSPVCALKPEQTSLAEQVDRAGLICVVEITKAEPPYTGSILETVKAPAAFNRKDVTFNLVSLRPQDNPAIKNGDKILVLLRETNEKKWELAAYGSQAVWPKPGKQWPYTEGHVASLDATVDTVKALLLPDAKSDESVKALIRSPIPLKRLVGLEMVARSDNPGTYPLAVAEAEQKVSDPQADVSRLAKSITSKLDETGDQ